MTVTSPDEISNTVKEGPQFNGNVSEIKPLSQEEVRAQQNLLESINSEPLVAGDKWFLLDIHWHDQLKKYLNSVLYLFDKASDYPGPIDNTPLLVAGEKDKVREHLLADTDYYLVIEKTWDYFYELYGLQEGQEPITRYVVEFGPYSLKVEVYLTELTLGVFKKEKVVKKSYSRVTTIEKVVRDIKLEFGIPEDEEVRLWNQFVKGTYELITAKQSSTLQECSISSGQMLLLETKENGVWPRQTRTRSISSSSSMTPATSTVQRETSNTVTASTFQSPFQRQKSFSPRQGLCGLNNLGNTCFMNAALQCLSNTVPLTKYFMANTHTHELNPSNPLGMHGKIAEAYGELMHQMWSGGNSSVSPRQFKMQVGRFAPQFSGYQQQDTHELLAFLLDGLHEDLNRVKQKPYIELQDDKGRPDEVVAAEAWTNHIRRNDSIIVDLFHGQFKSTVECPVCDKKSITFDPFCYLSLPLPMKKERNLYITFIPLVVSKKPIKLKVAVPKAGYTSDLARVVGKMTGCDSSKLVVFDVFGSRFHKKYHEKEVLSHINDRDEIYVYELPVDSDKTHEEDKLVLPVYLRKKGGSSTGYYSYSSASLFGVPLLVSFPRTPITAKQMHQIILHAMSRYVKAPPTLLQQAVNSMHEVVDEEMAEEKIEEKPNEETKGGSDDEMKIKHDAAEKEDETDDDGNVSNDESKEPEFLFDICVVNSSGSQEIKKILYEDEPLQLKSSWYLAADWNIKIKEKYYDKNLAMDVEEHESVSAPPPPKKTTQLQDCLELFLQREKLGEEDPWYCPVCKEHRQAYKKFDLWTLPKVLIIHLKRFSYSRHYRDKLDVLVNFPVNALDLTDYVINKKHGRAVYDLQGVSNHYGGLGGGHYTAYGINSFDGSWHYFDDSSVSSADAKSPVSKAAYVLFYIRRDDPDIGIMNTSELVTEDPDVFLPSDDDQMD